MTEPGAGSDLAGHQDAAARDGGPGSVNGAKTFISYGINADLVIVVARTDPSRRHGTGLQPAGRGAGHGGLQPRPQPRQDRAALAGHGGAVLRRGARARGQRARHGGARLPPPDAQPARRSGCRSRSTRSPGPARSSTRRWPTRRTAPRSASRSAPSSTTGSCSPRLDTELDIAQRLRRPLPGASSRRADRGGGGEGQVVDAPNCQSGSIDALRAAARRLRLHARVPGRPGLTWTRACRRIFGGTNEIMKEIVGRNLGV